MSSGHEGAGVNRRPEGASRWESIPAPSGPSPPEFLSHSATPNYSEEDEGSLSCSAHSKALKLVLLTDRFLPHAGSSRVYYYNLYENLVSQYPDQVTVLTKKVPGWQEFDRRESGVLLKIVRRFHPLPHLKYRQLLKIVFPLADSIRFVRKNQVDLIHAGDLYPQGVIGLVLKHGFGIPYIAYCHGGEVTQMDQRRYQHLVRDRIYHQADAVVAAGGFAQKQLLRIGIPESRICKITPGVDCERFSPRSPREDLVRRFSLQDKKVLLTVARLYPRKGHDIALQAIARIRAEFADLRYLIVGEGPEEARLRRMAAELGLADTVTFVGHVPIEELPDFYHLCDLFVMPNRQEPDGDVEGFGMVFLEANAAGKAVVGGRSGGVLDAILHTQTGFLVKPKDVEGWAATIKLLLSNPNLCHQMGARGLERARAQFSWKSRAMQLHQLSREVVQATRQKAWEKAPRVSSPQTS